MQVGSKQIIGLGTASKVTKVIPAGKALLMLTLLALYLLHLPGVQAQTVPNHLPVFQLTKTSVYPQQVRLFRNVTQPAALLQHKAAFLEARHDTAEVVVDYGREIVGKVSLYLNSKGTGKNSHLKLFYGEDLKEVLRNQEYTSGWYMMPKDSFQLEAGRQTLTNHGRRAFRYLRIVLPPGSGQVQLDSIAATLQHYPVQEAGYFSCADPQLNKIWEISAYTTKLCMQQYYEDGVKRDGLLWIGDYRVQFLCNILLFGDKELAKKSLFLMAASQRADGALPACAGKVGGEQHPENIDYMPGMPEGVNNWVLVNYCLDYISSLREYYLYTGDRQTLVQLWPSVVKLLPYLFAQQPERLKAGGEFITDTYYHAKGWLGSHGALAMQYYEAVQDALFLSELLQDDKVKKQCKDYLPKQRDHILSAYYAKDEQLFFDEPYSRISTSWHVNALSVLAGLQDGPSSKALLTGLANYYYPVHYPVAGFMLHWNILAKYKAGMPEEALQDIRRYWGHILQYNATTCWDLIDVKAGDHAHGKEFAFSRCHGWSAGPAFFFPAYILGVKPGKAGFETVVIEPQLGALQWAAGAIPTPKGVIQVRWERSPSLRGAVTIPATMSGEVRLAGKTIPLKPGINVITGVD